MTRFLSQRPFLSGQAATDTNLLPRKRPFEEKATLMPGASALSEQKQRYFSFDGDWLSDLPAGAEVMIPAWKSVPEGWVEVGGSTMPNGRRVIVNQFSFNYTNVGTRSWAVITPGNLFADAARQNPVTTPPAAVGGIRDASYYDNHPAQPANADRMVWDTYTRDGDTVSGLKSEASSQFINVPLDGTTAGAILVFFRDSAFYATADFGGSDVQFKSSGSPVEEVLFFDRGLTGGEVTFMVAAIRKDRNRQQLDNWVNYGTTSLGEVFRDWYWLTDFPVIDTSGISDFFRGWRNCVGLTSFPLLDFSAATSVYAAWEGCLGFTAFPLLDTSGVADFTRAWRLCIGLTDFPRIDTSSAINLARTWEGCSSLANMPDEMFDNAKCINYSDTWVGCQLTQQSVDNILVSVAVSLDNDASLINGTLDIPGPNNATPSAVGQAAADQLRAAGWTVTLNGY